MAMNIRIEKTGETFDIEPKDVLAVWFVLERAGIISYPSKKSPTNPKKKGIAVWSVLDSSDGNLPTVLARCPGCGSHQIFSDPPRQLKRFESVKDNSPMRNCKLEHCGRTDRIPDDIFHKFYDVVNGAKV